MSSLVPKQVLVWCGSGQMGGPPAESSPTWWELLSCPETSFNDLWALLASAGWEEAVQRNKISSLSSVMLVQSKFAGLHTHTHKKKHVGPNLLTGRATHK